LIYLRISVNRTSEHASIEQQRADCAALAARLGHLHPIEFVDEAVSAYQDRARPAYQRLLHHLEHSTTATVIVWHLDRLYRKPHELEQLLALLDTRPIRVESVQGRSFDLSRHEGRLFARQLVASANYESAHKGARVARAQQHRARRGLLHGGSHYGDLADGTLHPAQGRVLRRIVDDFLTGLSVSAIARELTDARILSPTGKNQWNVATLVSILGSNRLHHRNGDHNGAWERLITPDESALIRAIQLAPQRDATRSSRALLSAMARCGGRLVCAVNRHGRRLYRCRANPGSCGAVSSGQDRLDRTVLDDLESVVHDQSEVSAPLPCPSTLLSELETATKQRDNLAIRYATSALPRADYLRLREHRTSVIADYTTDLAKHLRARVRAAYPDGLHSSNATSISRMRTIVDAHVQSLVVRRGSPASSSLASIELQFRS